jgi:hypothetical protein
MEKNMDDVKVWTGSSWESIKGPKGDPGAAGPTEVSSDAGNATRIGSDGKVYTGVANVPFNIATVASGMDGVGIYVDQTKIPGWDGLVSADPDNAITAGSDQKPYINKTLLDARYVLANGDTMTGPLAISYSPKAGEVALRVEGGITAVGDLEVGGSITSTGAAHSFAAGSINVSAIGGLTAALDPRYVNVTGDTMTGPLAISAAAGSSSVSLSVGSAGWSAYVSDTGHYGLRNTAAGRNDMVVDAAGNVTFRREAVNTDAVAPRGVVLLAPDEWYRKLTHDDCHRFIYLNSDDKNPVDVPLIAADAPGVCFWVAELPDAASPIPIGSTIVLLWVGGGCIHVRVPTGVSALAYGKLDKEFSSLEQVFIDKPSQLVGIYTPQFFPTRVTFTKVAEDFWFVESPPTIVFSPSYLPKKDDTDGE